MKDEESLTTSPPSLTFSAGRTKYPVAGRIITGFKIWLLAAILFLALWSVFTSSVTLKGFFGGCDGGRGRYLCYLSGVNGFSGGGELDILEVEEREKVVRKMWDVYTRAAGSRLPRFWREAFEAAYEFLVSDSPEIRNAAVSDIAKLSLTYHSVNPKPLSVP
ncbi:PREDICTED: uncharacterized protein LOC104806349 [Tarenaya hassleriana]|uniref:uncharacterized protein LOC104806349 n=1 Tax=Tarenaya hassleriana TaxID=28532 RepID=UPI00053C86BC|nr:PREDICTED: uncharacterized protein LOC104806349 [Tarenaya hassleriana]